jgi:hypothetical protein
MDANKYASVSLPEHHALVLGALDGIKESLAKHSKEEAVIRLTFEEFRKWAEK